MTAPSTLPPDNRGGKRTLLSWCPRLKYAVPQRFPGKRLHCQRSHCQAHLVRAQSTGRLAGSWILWTVPERLSSSAMNEFTVNVALVENNRPVHGRGLMLRRWVAGSMRRKAAVPGARMARRFAGENRGRREDCRSTVAGSRQVRSHKIPRRWMPSSRVSGMPKLVAMGSSLKLCLVADGSADLYPRLGPHQANGDTLARPRGRGRGSRRGQVLQTPKPASR